MSAFKESWIDRNRLDPIRPLLGELMIRVKREAIP
jgi:hypothetical protein